MDWNQAIREERAMLMRIVALLLALADLAELACGRSRAVCSLLFWILSPAESTASAYADLQPDVILDPFARSGDSRIDLMELAWRLRELACTLECMAELTFPCRPEADRQTGSAPAPISGILTAALTALGSVRKVLVHDTS